jgi:hypothetical protein
MNLRCRNYSVASWVLFCLIGCADCLQLRATHSSKSSHEIRTSRLILIDDDGVERGILSAEPYGSSLTLMSKDRGVECALVVTDAGIGRISLGDSENDAAVNIQYFSAAAQQRSLENAGVVGFKAFPTARVLVSARGRDRMLKSSVELIATEEGLSRVAIGTDGSWARIASWGKEQGAGFFAGSATGAKAEIYVSPMAESRPVEQRGLLKLVDARGQEQTFGLR